MSVSGGKIEKQVLLGLKEFEEAREWWNAQLNEEPRLPDLWPGLRSSDPKINTLHVPVPPALEQKIREMSRGSDMGDYMILVTSLEMLCYKLFGPGGLYILIPSRASHEQAAPVSNEQCLLPLKPRPEAGFRDHLLAMRERLTGLFRNQHYPLSELLKAKEWGEPEAVSTISIEFEGINSTSTNTHRSALHCGFLREGDQLLLQLDHEEHNPEQAEFIRSLPQLWFRLLTKAFEAPAEALSDYDLLETDDKNRILREFNPEKPFRSERSVMQGYLLQLTRRPEAPALRYREQEWSYTRLRAMAAKAAYRLGEARIRDGAPVALLLERGPEMVASVLAVMMCGGCYVPIDPEWPHDRIEFVLKDSGSTVLISSSKGLITSIQFEGEVLTWGRELQADTGLIPAVTEAPYVPQQAAYMIYTSGSTGKPKGVKISQEAIASLLYTVQDEYQLGPEDNMLLTASYAFDISVYEMFSPLLAGATLVIPEKEDLIDIPRLCSYLPQVRFVHLVSTLMAELTRYLKENDLSGKYQHLRGFFTGGEKVNGPMIEDLLQMFPAARVGEDYGPTESTIICSSGDFRRDEPVNSRVIGKVLKNSRIYILDQDGKLAPVGVSGEICIGGSSVAMGYCNRPELDKEKFEADPFCEDGKIYRSGDLGRFLQDGSIEFLGRIDGQIKIRGYRIEPGEIENLLLRHPAVAEAHVMPVPQGDGQALCAWYAPAKRPELWPSISEYLVYDEIAYKAMMDNPQRVTAYREAIRRHVKGAVVVDLGTGPEAFLAQMCIEEGARKVYAIELLPHVYEKARETLRKKDLEDRIELIHGNILEVELPEKADWCVAALTGNLGGSEGAAVLIESARRFLEKPGNMIPFRSVNKIAAAMLPTGGLDMRLPRLSAHYVQMIFDEYGYPFDLRLCIRHFPKENLISDAVVFEDLDFTQNLEAEHVSEEILVIQQKGQLNGLLVWLEFHADNQSGFSSLGLETGHMPVWLPVFDYHVDVLAGDRISLRIERKLADNGINPDYFLRGIVEREGLENVPFEFATYNHAPHFRESTFYQSLLSPEGKPEIRSESDESELRDWLQAALPEYMVPAAFVRMNSLPKTVNTKIDRRALPIPEWETEDYAAARNEQERLLAGIWAEVLGMERVGIHSRFFSMGGDSIKSIQVASRLRRHGLQIDLNDLFAFPTVAELAPLMKPLRRQAEQGLVSGEAPLMPVQQEWLSYADPKMLFTQNISLQVPKGLDPALLRSILRKLTQHHDALRMELRYGPVGPYLYNRAAGEKEDFLLKVQEFGETETAPVNVIDGPLLHLYLRRGESHDNLLIILHHLVADGVSWRILLEDLQTAFEAISSGQEIRLPEKTDAFLLWAKQLNEYAGSAALADQRAYWREVVLAPDAFGNWANGKDYGTVGTAKSISGTVDAEQMQALQSKANEAFHTELNDLLITALCMAAERLAGGQSLKISMEGHGRESLGTEALDLSRTVGWFTSVYPVHLNWEGLDGADMLMQIKENLRSVPGKGLGYGVLKYLANEIPEEAEAPFISFNFLGEFKQDHENGEPGEGWELSGSGDTNPVDPEMPRQYGLEWSGVIYEGSLNLTLQYHPGSFDEQKAQALIDEFKSALVEIADICKAQKEPVFTPSDLGAKGMSLREWQAILSQAPPHVKAARIAPLSPMQEGMLFHHLAQGRGETYCEQVSYDLEGEVDPDTFSAAFAALMKRHAVLRANFYHEGLSRPWQVVWEGTQSDFHYADLRQLDAEAAQKQLEDYARVNRRRGFVLETDALTRVSLFRLNEMQYHVLWENHHMLFDGWSLPILLREFGYLYAQTSQPGLPELPAPADYFRYLDWLEQQDKQASRTYWKDMLSGYRGTATIPSSPTTDFDLREYTISIGEEETRALEALAHEQEATLNHAFQAAWMRTLAQISGNTDLCSGVVVSGRPAEIAGVEQMTGLFINTVPIRMQTEGLDAAKLMRELRDQSQARAVHEYLPLAEIQSMVASHGELFDHILVFENYPVEEALTEKETQTGMEAPFRVKGVEIFSQTNYPYYMTVIPGKAMTIHFRYNALAYDAGTIGEVTRLLKENLEKMSRGEKVIGTLERIEMDHLDFFNSLSEDLDEDF